MIETSAHLIDHVIPDVPVRQSALSFPWQLRLHTITRVFESRYFVQIRRCHDNRHADLMSTKTRDAPVPDRRDDDTHAPF